jgi:hypothetical protein
MLGLPLFDHRVHAHERCCGNFGMVEHDDDATNSVSEGMMVASRQDFFLVVRI